VTPWRRRRERRLLAAEELRVARRVVSEEVTVLGEQLVELHTDTLADVLDPDAQADYRAAIAAYERARTLLREAEDAADLAGVLAVPTPVQDGRFHRACVLARVRGETLPTRRDPCFFDPRHLPAVADVAWAPPGGSARAVPVCPTCRTRLSADVAPDVRLVRIGDRWTPWWETGGSVSAVVAHHAHVVRGTTSRTDAGVAEAMARAASNKLDGHGSL
jgi:hypothetical protein